MTTGALLLASEAASVSLPLAVPRTLLISCPFSCTALYLLISLFAYSHALPCSLRIYDTPSEAFQLAQQPPASTAAATAAAADAPAAEREPTPAGQRVPAQPPAAGGGGGAGGDSLAPALRVQEGELLYDWCWYAAMSVADPASCCLATTGRAAPIHLWDAVTGALQAVEAGGCGVWAHGSGAL